MNYISTVRANKPSRWELLDTYLQTRYTARQRALRRVTLYLFAGSRYATGLNRFNVAVIWFTFFAWQVALVDHGHISDTPHWTTFVIVGALITLFLAYSGHNKLAYWLKDQHDRYFRSDQALADRLKQKLETERVIKQHELRLAANDNQGAHSRITNKR